MSSPMIRRFINRLAVALVILAVIARLAAGHRIVAGHSVGTWALWVVLAISAGKLLQVVEAAARSHIPWTRVPVPALITLELFRLAQGYTSRKAMVVALAVLELGIAALVIAYLKILSPQLHAGLEPEERVEIVLSRFLPEDLSRWMACELVLLWLGLKWIFTGFRMPRAEGFDYTEGSYAALLPGLVLLLGVGEGVAWFALVHGRWPWVEVLLIVGEIWAVVWVSGAYVTFKTRPHRVVDGEAHLNKGIFAKCSFDLSLIESVTPGPSFEDPGTLPRNIVRLRLKGTPTLLLKLRARVEVCGYFGAARWHDLLLVSSSEPEKFRAALMGECAPVARARSSSS